MMDIQEKLYTADEHWEIASRPENRDKRLELYDGVIVEKDVDRETGEMSPSFLPSAIAVKLIRFISTYVDENALGYVTGADGTYRLSKTIKFIPDVGFISKAHLPEIPSRDVPVPPDFAVEVVSPTDSIPQSHRKAMQYLAHATRMVWVVYPDEQSVDVYRPAESEGVNVLTVKYDGVLDGYDVLPGFQVAVKDIFPA